MSRAEYDVVVYNQDFIDRHFGNYDNLAGVITVHEQNIEVQHQLADKKAQRKDIEERGKKLVKDQEDKTAARDTAARFQEVCRKKTSAIRETFKDALICSLLRVPAAGVQF